MNTQRIHNLFDANALKCPIHIIGCGATGSNLAVMLARAGVEEFYLHDYDKVEEHNLGNQTFTAKDVGVNKAKALYLILKEINETIKGGFTQKKITENKARFFTGVIIICTDDMKSRKAIWRGVKASTGRKLYIDVRMGVDTGRIWFVTIGKEKAYEETLYPENETEESITKVKACLKTSCGATAIMCGAYVMWNFYDWFDNKQTHKYHITFGTRPFGLYMEA